MIDKCSCCKKETYKQSMHKNSSGLHMKASFILIAICSLLVVSVFILLNFLIHPKKVNQDQLLNECKNNTGKGICIAIIDSGVSKEYANEVENNGTSHYSLHCWY